MQIPLPLRRDRDDSKKGQVPRFARDDSKSKGRSLVAALLGMTARGRGEDSAPRGGGQFRRVGDGSGLRQEGAVG